MNTTKRLRSPLQYVGGKQALVKTLVSLFPPDDSYEIFIDLFGGAANVLLAKSVNDKHLEVYNDLNSWLVNFWKTMISRGTELQNAANQFPYSRQLFYELKEKLKDRKTVDEFEQALAFFYFNRGSFGGKVDISSSWGYKKAKTSSAKAYRSAIKLFPIVQERMKNVQIDNRDFKKVIKTYQKEDAFFYVDPPYWECEYLYKRNDIGTNEQSFKHDDHRDLALLLNETPAKVMVSYADFKDLEELYPVQRWKRYATEVNISLANVNSTNRKKRKEVVLMNY